MRELFLIWGPASMIHLVYGVIRLFTLSENSIRISNRARYAILDVSLFVLSLMGYTNFTHTATGTWSSYLLVVGVFLYCIYASFAFRYQFTDGAFSWFNGLFIRTVPVQELVRVLKLRDNTRVAKIDLFVLNGRKRLRSDLPQIVDLLERVASQHVIPVESKRLPWWSL